MEEYIKIYIIVSTMLSAFLGFIWKSSDSFNTFIKFVLIIIAAFGILIILTDLGFIIKL